MQYRFRVTLLCIRRLAISTIICAHLKKYCFGVRLPPVFVEQMMLLHVSMCIHISTVLFDYALWLVSPITLVIECKTMA
jgi:hypothetical protein